MFFFSVFLTQFRTYIVRKAQITANALTSAPAPRWLRRLLVRRFCNGLRIAGLQLENAREYVEWRESDPFPITHHSFHPHFLRHVSIPVAFPSETGQHPRTCIYLFFSWESQININYRIGNLYIIAWWNIKVTSPEHKKAGYLSIASPENPVSLLCFTDPTNRGNNSICDNCNSFSLIKK